MSSSGFGEEGGIPQPGMYGPGGSYGPSGPVVPAAGAGPGAAVPDGPSDGKEGGLPAERLLLFTDAVTAISLTLLILPLVDLVPEAASAHDSARQVVGDHFNQIWSFILSFAVVARFWLAHHRVFSAVGSLNRPLVTWNMGWLLSIVALPFPTEIIGSFGHERFAAVLYYANLLATLVCQAAMLRAVRTHPETLARDDHATRRRLAEAHIEGYRNIVALIVALGIALAVHPLQYYSLLLLAVFPRVGPLRGGMGRFGRESGTG